MRIIRLLTTIAGSYVMLLGLAEVMKIAVYAYKTRGARGKLI